MTTPWLRSALLVTSLATSLATSGCGNSPVVPSDMACIAGQTLCGATCVDTRNDPKNCGGCATPCAQDHACVTGRCVLACPSGLTACDDKTCANLNTDVGNCGKCGTVCPMGNVCSAATCSLTCQSGLTNCNGLCVNTMSDLGNCGKCGSPCAQGTVCSAGACAVSCQTGLTLCNGTCVNLNSDNGNCGACGAACPMGQLCSMGKCAVTCQPGLATCNGVCANLQTDNANCGNCGAACPQGQLCAMGACAVTCQPGFLVCNGACVNPQTDNGNCGACAMACPNGQTCQAGKCMASCNMPLIACMGGCVDSRFDPANCGACGMACAKAPNGTSGCVMGACSVAGCNMGFLDCDKQVGNGCEVNSTNDSGNCGGCGKACKNTEACCNSGCLNVMVDNNNCGTCGTACGMGAQCCGGQCLDPKFSKVMSLNCAKPFGQFEVMNGDFSKQGAIDQLIADMNGLATVPANMNPPPAQSPFVWIAMHGSYQVNKVDAKTGAVLGTYPSRGHYPSRVAVALDNSVWVGNRGVDNPNDPTISNLVQILPDGTPGCTISHAADGAVVPFVRAVAIDGNGFVWFGTWNDARLHKVDPATCKVLADYPMNPTLNGVAYTSYPYGLIVDRNQIMWNSNLNGGSAWLGMDVSDPDPKKNTYKYAVPNPSGCSYGITADKANNIYLSNCAGPGIMRIDGQTHQYTATIVPNPVIPGNGGGSGMTIDLNGDIYQAGGWYGASQYVMKYQGGTGAYIGAYMFPAFDHGNGNSGSFLHMFGLAGDTFGKVWVTDKNSASLMRFKPDGTVEITTKLPGSDCYNYSDWNAIVLKTVTANNAQAGTWTQTFDSGSQSTSWATATWVANTPKGSSVAVYFKAANTVQDFANQKTCGPFYTQPVDLTACTFGPKQLLQVIVNLNTIDVNVRPSLTDLKVYYQ